MSEAHPVQSEMDLSDLNDAYENAAEGAVNEGEHEVTVEAASVRYSNAGNRMLEWQLRVESPDSLGELLFKSSMMETAENVRFLKRELRTCGFSLTKLSELPERVGELIGIRLVVKVRTKGEYQNIYFKRRVYDTPDAEVI